MWSTMAWLLACLGVYIHLANAQAPTRTVAVLPDGSVCSSASDLTTVSVFPVYVSTFISGPTGIAIFGDGNIVNFFGPTTVITSTLVTTTIFPTETLTVTGAPGSGNGTSVTTPSESSMASSESSMGSSASSMASSDSSMASSESSASSDPGTSLTPTLATTFSSATPSISGSTTGEGEPTLTLGQGLPSGTITSLPEDQGPIVLGFSGRVANKVRRQAPARATAAGFVDGDGESSDSCGPATRWDLKGGKLISGNGSVGKDLNALFAPLVASETPGEVDITFFFADGILGWNTTDVGAASFFRCGGVMYAGFPDAPFSNCSAITVGGVDVDDCTATGDVSTTASSTGQTSVGGSSSPTPTSQGSTSVSSATIPDGPGTMPGSSGISSSTTASTMDGGSSSSSTSTGGTTGPSGSTGPGNSSSTLVATSSSTTEIGISTASTFTDSVSSNLTTSSPDSTSPSTTTSTSTASVSTSVGQSTSMSTTASSSSGSISGSSSTTSSSTPSSMTSSSSDSSSIPSSITSSSSSSNTLSSITSSSGASTSDSSGITSSTSASGISSSSSSSSPSSTPSSITSSDSDSSSITSSDSASDSSSGSSSGSSSTPSSITSSGSDSSSSSSSSSGSTPSSITSSGSDSSSITSSSSVSSGSSSSDSSSIASSSSVSSSSSSSVSSSSSSSDSSSITSSSSVSSSDSSSSDSSSITSSSSVSSSDSSSSDSSSITTSSSVSSSDSSSITSSSSDTSSSSTSTDRGVLATRALCEDRNIPTVAESTPTLGAYNYEEVIVGESLFEVECYAELNGIDIAPPVSDVGNLRECALACLSYNAADPAPDEPCVGGVLFGFTCYMKKTYGIPSFNQGVRSVRLISEAYGYPNMNDQMYPIPDIVSGELCQPSGTVPALYAYQTSVPQRIADGPDQYRYNYFRYEVECGRNITGGEVVVTNYRDDYLARGRTLASQEDCLRLCQYHNERLPNNCRGYNWGPLSNNPSCTLFQEVYTVETVPDWNGGRTFGTGNQYNNATDRPDGF